VSYLDAARIPLQIDFGFGDAITPAALEVEYPTLLPTFPAPHLRAYPRETVVAEKLQALVVLDMGNSRLKDFYDLWMLSQNFPFDGATLARAVIATFERRQTTLPESVPVALTPRFTTDAAKVAAWRAFTQRNRLGPLPELDAFAAEIVRFVMPVFEAARSDNTQNDNVPSDLSFTLTWRMERGWE
jgi:hypothetical protein